MLEGRVSQRKAIALRQGKILPILDIDRNFRAKQQSEYQNLTDNRKLSTVQHVINDNKLIRIS